MLTVQTTKSSLTVFYYVRRLGCFPHRISGKTTEFLLDRCLQGYTPFLLLPSKEILKD